MFEMLASGYTSLPDIIPHAEYLDEWLRRGFNADMKWMERHAEVRKHPRTFNGKSYNAAWISLWRHKSRPAFAIGEDYHIAIGDILREKAERIGGQYFVDSLPIAERELAVLAGLGFIGKNRLLINPKFGSGFFIGGILLDDADVNVGARRALPLHSHPQHGCAKCRRCIDACPSKALTEDGFLDARRCASYLTIEHKGELSEQQKEWAKHCTYGCDVCQRVCPYNYIAARQAAVCLPPAFASTLATSGNVEPAPIASAQSYGV
ncbi:MAG: 4Fe-4S dicluster domain-containing protein [Fibromonadales bacterium]|nr:4Fe-4S dicluster domain-containing protein [Fibromonadales bacterium]